MRRQKMIMSTLYCDECGHPFTIARKIARQRGSGHVKHMYCAFCKKKTPFIEGDEHHDSHLDFWEHWHDQQLGSVEKEKTGDRTE